MEVMYGAWKKVRWEFYKGGEIHGVSNVWSAAQRYRKSYGFDIHVGVACNYESFGCSKQCSLVWPCVEERRWQCVERVLDFEVECRRKNGRVKRTRRKQL